MNKFARVVIPWPTENFKISTKLIFSPQFCHFGHVMQIQKWLNSVWLFYARELPFR